MHTDGGSVSFSFWVSMRDEKISALRPRVKKLRSPRRATAGDLRTAPEGSRPGRCARTSRAPCWRPPTPAGNTNTPVAVSVRPQHLRDGPPPFVLCSSALVRSMKWLGKKAKPAMLEMERGPCVNQSYLPYTRIRGRGVLSVVLHCRSRNLRHRGPADLIMRAARTRVRRSIFTCRLKRVDGALLPVVSISTRRLASRKQGGRSRVGATDGRERQLCRRGLNYRLSGRNELARPITTPRLRFAGFAHRRHATAWFLIASESPAPQREARSRFCWASALGYQRSKAALARI